MKELRGLMLVILVVLLLGSLGSAQAQDDVPTVEPTEEVIVVEATEVATVEATVEPTPEATPYPLNESDRVSFSWTVASQVMLAVIVSFMAGGLTVGGGILLVLRTVLNNKTLSDMVEKLWMSQPLDKQNQQRNIVKGVREVAEGLDTLTDGKLSSEIDEAVRVS